MIPTVDDARRRAVVRLDDGRSARLLSVPAQSRQRSAGGRARVRLQSGAILSVHTDSIRSVEVDA